MRKSCTSSWSQTRPDQHPKPSLTKGRSICVSILSASGAPERRHASQPNRTSQPLSDFKVCNFFWSTRWAFGCHLEKCWSSLFPLKAIFCSIFCAELMNGLNAWKFTACFMFRYAQRKYLNRVRIWLMSLLFSSRILQKPRIAVHGSSNGRVRQSLHQLVSEFHI